MSFFVLLGSFLLMQALLVCVGQNMVKKMVFNLIVPQFFVYSQSKAVCHEKDTFGISAEW